MNHFSRICVYCGAHQGTQPAYLEAATALGDELARRGLGLVYGGGSVGLMGALARSVRDGGSTVTGVIPQPLMPKEISGEPIGQLIVVDSMHSRKARMAELADGFVALPGGFGTFEELFETITWSQLGIHHKPIGLLNVAGYFDPLSHLIDQAIAAGFVRPTYSDLLVVAADPVELLDKLAAHEPPASLVQWATEEQA